MLSSGHVLFLLVWIMTGFFSMVMARRDSALGLHSCLLQRLQFLDNKLINVVSGPNMKVGVTNSYPQVAHIGREYAALDQVHINHIISHKDIRRWRGNCKHVWGDCHFVRCYINHNLIWVKKLHIFMSLLFQESRFPKTIGPCLFPLFSDTLRL
jgi:hypothetical protein